MSAQHRARPIERLVLVAPGDPRLPGCPGRMVDEMKDKASLPASNARAAILYHIRLSRQHCCMSAFQRASTNIHTLTVYAMSTCVI